jgi:hypothetical protein
MVTKIRGLQIADATFGAALGRNGTNQDIIDVKVDDSTIEVNNDALRIKAGAIANNEVSASAGIDYSKLDLAGCILGTDINGSAAIAYSKLSLANSIVEADLAMANSPTTDYVITWNGSAMEWAAADTSAVMDADIVANEIPAGSVNGTNVAYALADAPVSTSVQIYLNGLMQQPGSGKDYELSGTALQTVTFATAPETGDILLANYVIDN